MTTMLTRASHAVEDALASDDNHPDDIARAVLMAVREPDGDVVAAGERAAWDSSKSMPAIRAMSVGFDAMIDAILEGK